MGQPNPFVSIIIPFYNDFNGIKKCLKALDAQTYPKTQFDVLVVDNGSDKSIEPLVTQYNNFKLLYESQPGSYAARNKGISVAKGEILGFTDSDCIPSPNWIQAGVIALTECVNCGLVAGKIKFFVKERNRPTAVEFYESANPFPQRYYVEKEKYGVTANIFTYKHVFEKIGPFNANLKSGGDLEWGNRVYLAGYQLIYSDAVYIAHPARRSFKELKIRVERLAGGHMDKKSEMKRSWIRFLFGLLKHSIHHWIRVLPKLLLSRNLKGIIPRIKVIYVHSFTYCIFVVEIISIKLGRESKR